MSPRLLAHALLASAVLLLSGIVMFGGLIFYWYFLDIMVPAVVTYQHMHFISGEAHSRIEADTKDITQARSGDVVYRYLEYCVDRNIRGTIRASWVNGVAYMLPDVSTIGTKGCYQRTLALEVPLVKKPVTLRYVQTAYYPVNPMRTNTLMLAPMSLEVVP